MVAKPAAELPEASTVERERLAAFVGSRMAVLGPCYEKERKKVPGLKGKIVVRFTVAPPGTTHLDVTENSLRSEAVADCIKTMLRDFEPPSGVALSFPFVFAP